MAERRQRPCASRPVAIGGLGGSGTRLVAEIVQRLGFYLGRDLNRALDNLWFTMLFTRPGWYRRSLKRGGGPIRANFALFERAMTSGEIGLRDVGPLLAAAGEVAVRGHHASGSGKGLRWPARRLRSILDSEPRAPGRPGAWGWKEPNTHIFLPHLVEHDPGLRYVHVIRHGYEVACGRKQSQLYYWGRLFGVEPPEAPSQVPAASLRYWARSNTQTLRFAESHLGDRFLLVNYNRLCSEPRPVLDELLAFLDCEVTSEERDQLAAVPDGSRRRSRPCQFDPASFDPADVATLSRLGFDPGVLPA
jgi:Sulfotransferase family